MIRTEVSRVRFAAASNRSLATGRWSLAAGLLLAAGIAAQAQIQAVGGPVSVPHQQLGSTVVAVPDINGDGMTDVAVVADDEFPGFESNRVFVYSGATGGFLRVLSSVNIGGTPQPFFISGIAGLRDVDGDGRGDLAIADARQGHVLVISGATLRLIHVLDFPPNPAATLSVSGMEDLDNDGRGDLIVGQPASIVALGNTGSAYIYSGATGARLRTVVPVPPSPPFLQGDRLLGRAVLGTPDLNGDGKPDAIVAGYGAISWVSGATGVAYRRITAPANSGGFTQSISVCPDANGDGVADLVVGAPTSGLSLGPTVRGLVAECGRAYLYSGATGAILRSWAGPTVAGTRFGWSVSGVPDVTGDGRGDVVIGLPSTLEAERGTGFGPGRVQVFNGATGALVTTIDSPRAELGGGFGFGVIGLPDTNANGRGDIFISAPQEDAFTPSAFDKGRAYFVRF
ncbi:MAG: VCBS repeat-containing protein [Phycisphaerales bacterium]